MHRVPALGFLLLVSFPSVLRAQSTNASLTGRVTDPSKATIAEAKVAAINLGTNYRYGSTTNGAGEYTLANLPPGTYRLEVEKPGFKKLIRPDVLLHVQDALAINFGTIHTRWLSHKRGSAASVGNLSLTIELRSPFESLTTQAEH